MLTPKQTPGIAWAEGEGNGCLSKVAEQELVLYFPIYSFKTIMLDQGRSPTHPPQVRWTDPAEPQLARTKCPSHQSLPQEAWTPDVHLHLSECVTGSRPSDVQTQMQTSALVLNRSRLPPPRGTLPPPSC